MSCCSCCCMLLLLVLLVLLLPQLPVSLSALQRAGCSGSAALLFRGRVSYTAAAADDEQQQQQQQRELEVLVPVPLSVLLRPAAYTPESLGQFMVVSLRTCCLYTAAAAVAGVAAGFCLFLKSKLICLGASCVCFCHQSQGSQLAHQSAVAAVFYPGVSTGGPSCCSPAAAKRLIAMLAAAANMQLVEVQQADTGAAAAAAAWKVKGLLAATMQQQQQRLIVALVSCCASQESEGALQLRVAVKGCGEETVGLAETLQQLLETLRECV